MTQVTPALAGVGHTGGMGRTLLATLLGGAILAGLATPVHAEGLLADDVLGGIDAGFSMTLVAVSLAAGLLLANVAVPARRAL